MATKPKKNLQESAQQSLALMRAELAQLSRDLEMLEPLEIKSSVGKSEGQRRMPGRFKGRLLVGKQFFEPLTDEELKELSAE